MTTVHGLADCPFPDKWPYPPVVLIGSNYTCAFTPPDDDSSSAFHPSLDGEEIRSHNHIPMPGEKLPPGGFPLTLRRRFQAVLPQNVGDRAPRHFMAQIGEGSLDSAIAPAPILRSHADYQTLDLFSHTRTTWPTLLAAIIFPGDQPAMPSQERCRRHDGRQIMKHAPAQFLSPHRQASVLIVIEMQPLASQLLAQHAVLLLKIIEGLLLPLV